MVTVVNSRIFIDHKIKLVFRFVDKAFATCFNRQRVVVTRSTQAESGDPTYSDLSKCLQCTPVIHYKWEVLMQDS